MGPKPTEQWATEELAVTTWNTGITAGNCYKYSLKYEWVVVSVFTIVTVFITIPAYGHI